MYPDWFVTHARIEIFTEETRVGEIVNAIMEEVHTSMPGDGIVAVLPAEKLYHIRTKTLITGGELWDSFFDIFRRAGILKNARDKGAGRV